MSYQTIFIDWDGTLSISKFWQHWATTRPDDLAKVQSELFINSMALVNQWMRGQRSAEDCLKQIEPTVNIPFNDLFEGLQHSCQTMTFISPRIPQLIQQLRQRDFKVVIATDNMDTFHRWTIPSLGLDQMFDDILDSNRLGFFKTDRLPDQSSAFFGAYLTSHHLDPKECVLIDDSPSNTIVQQFGLNYHHIDRGNPFPALEKLL